MLMLLPAMSLAMMGRRARARSSVRARPCCRSWAGCTAPRSRRRRGSCWTCTRRCRMTRTMISAAGVGAVGGRAAIGGRVWGCGVRVARVQLRWRRRWRRLPEGCLGGSRVGQNVPSRTPRLYRTGATAVSFLPTYRISACDSISLFGVANGL